MEEKKSAFELGQKETHEVQPYLQTGIYLKATHTDRCKTSFDVESRP